MGFWLQKRPLFTAHASNLYAAVTCRARQVVFYQDYQIPDTPQGRFEVLALHLALLLRRLKVPQPGDVVPLTDLGQDLCDWIVADVEESLRVMRLSESKIPGYRKRFVEGFYGRLVAYDKALALSDVDMLKQAIRRNIYCIQGYVANEVVEGLAAYTFQTSDFLQGLGLPQIMSEFKRNIPYANRPSP